MDYSLPGSSVRGIFQAGVLEWGAIAFSVSSSQEYLKNGVCVCVCVCVCVYLTIVLLHCDQRV